MDEARAVEVITDAVENDSAMITTHVLEERREALESLPLGERAPTAVTRALDLDEGALWGEVVSAILAEAENGLVSRFPPEFTERA
jgi:hypothetical protein